MASNFPQIVYKLLEPIPQYVLGCFPAMLIIGASPMKFSKKLTWAFLCLGCPFIGLFYVLNVEKGSRCIYWLSSEYFDTKYRPFGIHTMKLRISPEITTCIKRCTAKVSVLERFMSGVSVYYIVIGSLAGISMVTGPIACESWPYIPLLMSWTIPILCWRIFSEDVVVNDPNEEFRDSTEENRRIQIIMDDISSDDKNQKRATLAVTAFLSILYPWITVILAYFTPPIGYFCRSKYVTVLCAIWSFNSILACLFHLKGERKLIDKWFHLWFFVCGAIIAGLLFILALLTNNNQWWVNLFGNSCDVSNFGCV
ncbi:hypothetical protein C1645_865536 [Glomus cerebriforme]|uniref:Uncharacterized protein n=1 Tax=Glomus cerebriforme TaxID=658196 RepID=A0A397SEB9_9GLOM|nr:hypothetical protein C1645_865536 [Glomus cerebriforme]